MIVKVIIKRQVKKGKEDDFFAILKSLRSAAIHQQGYISGQTLVCAEDTNMIMVISKWASLGDWETWKASEVRKELDDALTSLQKKPATYEPYVFSKYKVAAEHGFPLPLQDQQL